ncbi:MAG TPA: DUF1476 domain-containing protein [Hyphomicrobiales bacterium]|nr:DUF1476 domain-containing protein [Hyphomicrobiales bacterium]
MTTFDRREEAFERHLVLDEELRFRAIARRNRRLGKWAAGLLGLEGMAVEDYENALIAADLEEAGEEDVFRKLRSDFDAKGLSVSDHQIRRQMNDLLEAALTELKSGG